MRVPGHLCNKHSSVATIHNALKRALHAAQHTSGTPNIATVEASALGTGSRRQAGGGNGGGGGWREEGLRTREKATVFHLKPSSRDGGVTVGDHTRRYSEEPEKFSRARKVCARRKITAALRPTAAAAGTEPKTVLAARARGKGREGPECRASARPRPSHARASNSHAREGGRKRRRAPPHPACSSHPPSSTLFSPPLSFPAKGGLWREARLRRRPGAGAEFPQAAGRGRSGRAAPGLTSAALRPAAKH